MYSSRKSSGNPSPRMPPARGVFSSIGITSQLRFTAIANAADERRQIRREQQRAEMVKLLNYPLPLIFRTAI